MANLNSVHLIGNLTRDPEVRHTPKGTAVGDLGLAINESYTNQAGEKQEVVVFVDVTVWGRQAETCKEFLQKGSSVFIDGKLQLDQWQDKDGQPRSRIKVRAERVQFLSTRRNASQEKPEAPKEPESRFLPDDEVPF